MRGEDLTENDVNLKNIPHFEMDVNIDGVELFNNSEQAELIPILAVVHSIKKSAHCKEKKQILKSSIPVLLGYYHGQGKPEIKKFLAPLLRDLKRLTLTIQTKEKKLRLNLLSLCVAFAQMPLCVRT